MRSDSPVQVYLSQGRWFCLTQFFHGALTERTVASPFMPWRQSTCQSIFAPEALTTCAMRT
jgi:hypothetical protein